MSENNLPHGTVVHRDGDAQVIRYPGESNNLTVAVPFPRKRTVREIDAVVAAVQPGLQWAYCDRIGNTVFCEYATPAAVAAMLAS